MSEPFTIYREDRFNSLHGGMNLKDYTERLLNEPRKIKGIVQGMPSTYTSPSIYLENANEHLIRNNIRNGTINQMYLSRPIDKKENTGYTSQSPMMTQPSTISMAGNGLTDYDKSNIQSQIMKASIYQQRRNYSEQSRKYDIYINKLERAAKANTEIKEVYGLKLAKYKKRIEKMPTKRPY